MKQLYLSFDEGGGKDSPKYERSHFNVYVQRLCIMAFVIAQVSSFFLACPPALLRPMGPPGFSPGQHSWATRGHAGATQGPLRGHSGATQGPLQGPLRGHW